MQITDVRVFPVRDDKLKAFVSVVFESCFMVNDIKVINGRDGYFISMPSRRKKNGEFKDIAHPLNTDTRRLLEERILDEYEQVVALDTRPARRYEKDAPVEKNAEKNDPPEERADPRRSGDAGAVAATAAASKAPETAPSSDAPAQVREAAREPDPTEGAVSSGRDGSEPINDDADGSSEKGEANAGRQGTGETDRRDLDEVVEDHLSDAFWS